MMNEWPTKEHVAIAAIECAARALCWAGRPVLTTDIFPMASADSDPVWTFWRSQSESDRRIYLYRARVTLQAWEDFWETHNAV